MKPPPFDYYDPTSLEEAVDLLQRYGDEATVRAYAEFGDCLGQAYQIRDDYLGIWGDQATLGNSTGNDIRRRQKSYPGAFDLERAVVRAMEALHQFHGQELSDEDKLIVDEDVWSFNQTFAYTASKWRAFSLRIPVRYLGQGFLYGMIERCQNITSLGNAGREEHPLRRPSADDFVVRFDFFYCY